MGHLKLKTLIGLASILAWIFFLHFSETAEILIFYLSLPIALTWLAFGLFSGLTLFLATCVYLLYKFQPATYIPPLVFLIITSALTHKLRRVLEKGIRNSEIEEEKIEEELNLLSDGIKAEENDNARIKSSLTRTAYLKHIIEDYSLTLSEEEILDSITKNSFELFKSANRVLLYLVDTEKQELELVRSRKRNIDYPVKAKKGDIYDRWALKHRMPLLVDDINKDFRFSLKEERDKGFRSIISAPLTSEHKILGILRVDSSEAKAFNQSDLRFLDIISDLSSVSLQNSILYQKVQDLAIHDSLTGLSVHKYFMERLETEVKSSLRNDMEISLLMLDLDDFKHYNDKYGHNVGDLILKHVSSILKSFSKVGDVVSRYGGEEFAILLLNSDKSQSAQLAEKIRQKIDNTPLVLRRESINITVSIGVASCPQDEKMFKELLRLADHRLYKAKEGGKNRVCSN